MFAMNAITKRGSAVAACLVILALIVGPACAGLCAGSDCSASVASSGKESVCHHAGHEHSVQFSRAANAGACRAADASLTMTSKPNIAAQGGATSSKERVFSASDFHLSNDATGSPALLFSGGHSPGALPSERTVSILRL